ncbi:MAG: M23 family metallopeptidase [Oligoflexia bacterium]|nr:M23 family metallopeptidase [Oligoflexia bacterium]
MLKLGLALISVVICSAASAFVSESTTLKVLATRGDFSNQLIPLAPLARWQSPVKNIPVTSCYGPRRLLNKFADFHEGIDYGAATNTPVHAVASGKVLWTGFVGCSGHVIILQHRLKNRAVVYSLYKHLKNFVVKVGQQVRPGQMIAYSGSSGRQLLRSQEASKRGCVIGPHLHVEFKLLRPGLTAGSVQETVKRTRGHLSDMVMPMHPALFIPELQGRCS